MRYYSLGLTVCSLVGLSGCVGTGQANRQEPRQPGPVRTITAEQGVIPAGTMLVVRTNDTVNTLRGSRDTLYDASIAEDIVDQDGRVLIPKDSPVELGVRLISFLGPGGAGTTELLLGVRSVTVNGARYPVDTTGNPRDRNGGLPDRRHTAQWINDGATGGNVLTSGSHIDVPNGTLLAFHIDDQIRLRGYQR